MPRHPQVIFTLAGPLHFCFQWACPIISSSKASSTLTNKMMWCDRECTDCKTTKLFSLRDQCSAEAQGVEEALLALLHAVPNIKTIILSQIQLQLSAAWEGLCSTLPLSVALQGQLGCCWEKFFSFT